MSKKNNPWVASLKRSLVLPVLHWDPHCRTAGVSDPLPNLQGATKTRWKSRQIDFVPEQKGCFKKALTGWWLLIRNLMSSFDGGQLGISWHFQRFHKGQQEFLWQQTTMCHLHVIYINWPGFLVTRLYVIFPFLSSGFRLDSRFVDYFVSLCSIFCIYIIYARNIYIIYIYFYLHMIYKYSLYIINIHIFIFSSFMYIYIFKNLKHVCIYIYIYIIYVYIYTYVLYTSYYIYICWHIQYPHKFEKTPINHYVTEMNIQKTSRTESGQNW